MKELSVSTFAVIVTGFFIGGGVLLWCEVLRAWLTHHKLFRLLSFWQATAAARWCRRWPFLSFVGWCVASMCLLDVFGSIVLMPSCVGLPLGLSVRDGNYAVLFGLWFGLTHRNRMLDALCPDLPPGVYAVSPNGKEFSYVSQVDELHHVHP